MKWVLKDEKKTVIMSINTVSFFRERSTKTVFQYKDTKPVA